MKTQYIIGKKIIDILIWLKTEDGGLDEADISIQLDCGEIIGIPWHFDSENIEKQPKKGSKSLFADLSDIPEYQMNPDGKTIQEVIETKRKRESSFLGRIKKAFSVRNEFPGEYKVYKTEYTENKLKYLKGQKIIDFLMFDDADSAGYLELKNGYIITENLVSPNGAAMARLNYYCNLKSFEDHCGNDYKRLKNTSH